MGRALPLVNDALDKAAAGLRDRVTLVDPPSFVGHGCTAPWFTTWMLHPGQDACFHPNARGHSEISGSVLAAIHRNAQRPRATKRLLGHWAGPLLQRPGQASTYGADVRLRRMVPGRIAGTIAYPELGCAGSLTSLGVTSDGQGGRFRERILSGSRCADRGLVELDGGGRGPLSLRWSKAETGGWAYGSLARVG